MRDALERSGEPPVHQLRHWYENQNVEPSSSANFWALCQQLEIYRADYHNYWTSTCEKTIAKRPVDAVILPVAPSAAVAEGQFAYYGTSPFASHKTGLKQLPILIVIQHILPLQMSSTIRLAASP